MTYAPSALLQLRAYLVPRTGITDFRQLGITPDPNHNGGYHCGWDQRRIVDGRLADYSWTESTRDSSHHSNAARAIDIGQFARLRELSVWLVGQCAAGAPDTADIREVIYSPDGKTVKRWDRLGRRTSGDNSHLTHTHISYFADAEDRDKTGPFRRFFEGDMMAINEVDFTALIWRVQALVGGLDAVAGGPVKGEANLLRRQLDRLEAAAVEEKTRDAATKAAIEALAEALKAGGGNADTAAILARIDERAQDVRADVEQRHQVEMTEMQRAHSEALRDRLAEIDGLRAELARREQTTGS